MRDSWEIRFEWIQTILQWVALVLGVGLSVVQYGVEPGTVTASAAVTAYTIGIEAIPERSRRTTLVGALLSLLGVATSLFAVSLTGGLESAFLLYLTVPVFFASAFYGTALGSITTLAAIGGVIALSATSSTEYGPNLFLTVAFYALIGITVSQARRILIEEPGAGSRSAQFARLESAHRLLADLADLAPSAELNPITIGRAALRDLAVSVPFAAGTVTILDSGEEFTVAIRGRPGPLESAEVFPISLADEPLGHLTIWPAAGTSLSAFATEVDDSTQALSLAFDNVLLLQSIARRAVREERIRLARELHDDIGPSLVSVGLGLDLTIHQEGTDEDTRRHLRTMRETITELVDKIRASVSHLRSNDTSSLLEHAHALAADAPTNGPSVVVSLRETGLPSPPVAEQLAALMTEAVRNAIDHAEATVVRVEGVIDQANGQLTVSDDGIGFDNPSGAPGRFGIIGMHERAEKVGADLTIDSSVGRGTSVVVTWGGP